MKSITSRFAILALILVTITGCGKDKKSTSPNGDGNNNTIIFVGTVNGANGILSGWVSFSVNDTAVTGTFKIVTPDTATYALTGIYETTTKVLVATGSGINFGGVYDGTNRLEGAVTGNRLGTFLAIKDDNNTALAFCGTFSGDDDGVWNFTIDGTIIAGSYTTTSGNMGALDGSISGTTITVTNPAGGGSLATGTRSGNNASGTWDDGQGNSGSWIGYRTN
ncbi:MAG TPA: hypothetical protein DEO84_09170 [candidate division Zixibacteria bacterium]|nr:hypothetical protein [candidate division Zixibacteria bacterium]HBZ01473.1 hypothetical protein [candidate division Zixibacteria bacterium]